MRLHEICFVSAALAALVGMLLGFAMGIAGDFTLGPAHAHLNLLGWVTMALMGLYYRGAGSWRRRLAWTQVTLGVAGFWTFPVMLGVHLHGIETVATVPIAIAGSVLAIVSMAMFFAVVVLDIRDRAAVPTRHLAASG